MKSKILKKFISIFKKGKNTLSKSCNSVLIDWASFQGDVGYKIRDKKVFINALFHSSFSNSLKDNDFQSNERLEFLGDGVLNLAIGEFLYRRYPESSEGELTKMRSVLVSQKVLAKKGQELNLGRYVILGPGEEKTGGRKKGSILADTLEAVIGAIYLERGPKSAKKFIERNILNEYQIILSGFDVKNYKGELLEYCQQNHIKIPKYNLKEERGAEHLKTYTIEVKIGKEILGIGKGSSKKEAEQKASESALKNLKVI